MKVTTLSSCSLLSFVSYAGILSLPLAMMVLRSASDFFCTSAECRSGILSFSPIIVFPAPSGPWHMAHLPLKRLSPVSWALTGRASRRAPHSMGITNIGSLKRDSVLAFMETLSFVQHTANPEHQCKSLKAIFQSSQQGMSLVRRLVRPQEQVARSRGIADDEVRVEGTRHGHWGWRVAGQDGR